MDLNLNTNSSIDQNAIILVVLGILVAGAGIILIAKIAK